MPSVRRPLRLEGAMRSLNGLSVGDAFGQCFFSAFHHLPRKGENPRLPAPPWVYTDDTVQACAIVDCLAQNDRIDQDALANDFARRYMLDPNRGYGGGAKIVLTEIYCGTPWANAARAAFDGGSLGNGAAMRVAPLGAYFADDIPTLTEQARLSAEPTHLHEEAAAGAIAIALAASFAANHSGEHSPRLIREFLDFVVAHTPPSETRLGLERAAELPRSTSIADAVIALGNGSKITCPDTVPFCVWSAARNWTDYCSALWDTVRALGDIDTNCAIVGGIVSLAAIFPAVPPEWLEARGRIPIAH